MRRPSLIAPLVLTLIAGIPLVLSGCKPQSETEKRAQHDDDHEGEQHHHHDHEGEGPHGGHLLQFGGDTKYQAEWLHDDAKGEITVYLLQADGKTPVENPPEEMTIEVPGETPKTYTLPAVEPAMYGLTDPALLTALEIVVEGEEPVLRAKVGDSPVSAKFMPHEHDEHEHGHD